MNEYHLISSNDHSAWQKVHKCKDLKAVGNIKCISLTGTQLNGNDDYLIAGLSKLGDANTIKVEASHKLHSNFMLVYMCSKATD